MSRQADPTETTSLLPQSQANVQVEVQSLPAILSSTVRRFNFRVQDISVSDLCPDTIQSDNARTAFSLLVLLVIHAGKSTRTISTASGNDLWENWSNTQDEITTSKDIEGHILSIWTQYLQTYRSSADIEATLWMKFPLETGGKPRIRVMDFLHLGSAPQGFLTHPMIDLSVMNTWTHGLSFCDANDMPPNRLLRKFDSMSTPRVLHAVALAGQLAALVALAHYLLYPPRFVITLDVSEQGPREIFLLIMAAASLSSPWSWRMIPSVLIFLAFILRLPGVPTPGDLSFATLLLAFYFHTIVLHLPNAPGPMFLLNPQSALPLSSLLLHGVTQVFLPIAGYFLPALLFASWLVSNSMQDTFLAQIGFQATPMDSRIIFLLLFATEILLILYAFGMGLLTFRPPLSAHSSRWDRYSGTLGVQARKCFIRSLVTYEKYTFPPPFNLLQLLLIRAPATLLFLYKDGQFSSIRAADRVLWRITVGWIGLLMSGIWLWGFL